MTKKYKLNQIRANKNATWKWKINMACNVCNKEKESGCDTVLFDVNDVLTAGFICEDCWNEFKEF